ncbi:GNAT family N-acetyltransferase [Pseudodonghicola flavimaris]|uniref:GNAT family N-acetyltransferase n=1 Tax=Pseudodonghicola flavimaris TaxID=3050036 RepID=A0ABT7F4P4_9RHOB|nr:GNAT family N-acetyltransferase [Pseudodonghicola flavimaris]MDK3019566.1 GNAT family N-acetyltransferase [Pseudodonghicola flavimaris]
MTPADMAATHAAAFTQSRPWRAEEFADLLSMSGSFACGDARCFALVRVIADEAELLTIATHPDHQRLGLARALMPLWQAEAAGRGATRAFLEVAADNAPARALYLQTGYEAVGLRRGYYPRPSVTASDAILMALSLRPSTDR